LIAFFCTHIVQNTANSMLELVASAHTVQPPSACTVHTVDPHSLFTQYNHQYTHSTLAVHTTSALSVLAQYRPAVQTTSAPSVLAQYMPAVHHQS